MRTNNQCRHAAALIVLVVALPALASDWPQAGAGPARISYTPDEPIPSFSHAWSKSWAGEELHRTNYPIVVGDVVYVGTPAGKVHAFRRSDGATVWDCDLGPRAIIINSLAGDSSRIYAAALNGTVYAIDRSNGQPAWNRKLSRRGFSGHPLLYNNRLFVGSRDGRMHALNAEDGNDAWSAYYSGAPIVAGAAAADGKVVFVNEAMKLFCLNDSNGQVVWGPITIEGRTLRDYYPVIGDGKVFVRICPAASRALTGQPHKLNSAISPKATTIQMIIDEQDNVQNFYLSNPRGRTLLVRNLSNGQEPYTASTQHGCCNRGTYTPMFQAKDGNGNLQWYTMFKTSGAGGSGGGFVDICDVGIGTYNATTGLLTTPLIAGRSSVGTIIGKVAPFELTGDETVNLSGAGRMIFGARTNAVPGYVYTHKSDSAVLPVVYGSRGYSMMATGTPPIISEKYVLQQKMNRVICWAGTGVVGGETPVVTVAATDSDAGEPGNDGEFTIARSGSTSGELVVNIAVSGPAINGTDYNTIQATATIPSDQPSVKVVVDVIDDSDVEGNEDVTLTIQPSSGYTIGSPASASITIVDDDGVADQSPFHGDPFAIPARIEAEDFDLGGNGVAYYDDDAGNQVPIPPNPDYRPEEDVDINYCTDAGGGYNVGRIHTNEWLEYTVAVPADGEYTVSLRVATVNSGKHCHVEIDGSDITGQMGIPNTGGWQTWQTVSVSQVYLEEGVHVLRVAMDTDAWNLNWIEIAGANQAPTAVDDAYSTAQETPLAVQAPGVLGNDTDPESDELEADVVTAPSHGSLNLSSDGSFTYIPDADYNGPDSFTYEANDGQHDSGTATVSIMVQPMAGDCNLDGHVNFTDLGILISNYNLPGGWTEGDFSGDGMVGFTDLGQLIANYGR